MKYFFVMLLLVSCNQQKDISKQSANEIIKADKDMNELAAKEGFYKALLLYADDSVVKPNEGELLVIGKAALEKYWKNEPDTKAISWQPFKAEASSTGELGYTLGNWRFVSKDTTMYGNYITVWKKQTDGNWKFVFDGGNNTPKPQ